MFVLTFAVILRRLPARVARPVVRRSMRRAADTEYARAHSLLLTCGSSVAQGSQASCSRAPMTAAQILFHSECSVIANNFILREPDKECTSMKSTD